MTKEEISKNFSSVARKMLSLFKESEIPYFRTWIGWTKTDYRLLFINSGDCCTVEYSTPREHSMTRVFKLADSGSECYWCGEKSFNYVEGEAPKNIEQRHMEALLINWNKIKSELSSVAIQRSEALNSFVL